MDWFVPAQPWLCAHLPRTVLKPEGVLWWELVIQWTQVGQRAQRGLVASQGLLPQGVSDPPWLTKTPLNLPQPFLRCSSSVYLLSYLSVRKFKCQEFFLFHNPWLNSQAIPTMLCLATKPEGLVNRLGRPASQSLLQVVHRHIPNTAITNSGNKNRSWSPWSIFPLGYRVDQKGENLKSNL